MTEYTVDSCDFALRPLKLPPRFKIIGDAIFLAIFGAYFWLDWIKYSLE